MSVIDFLIKIRFDLDRPKNNGITALGIAAFKEHIEAMDALMIAGSNINY